ncbi:hypothetical protein HXX76_001102 [Chlamydomonas incerta]|uniref:Cyclic nucleotide-binding domain-containing protein n=1 Tax=Chlamydomonas incerta TaxID=51695 RepID=A0A835WBK2_CHLIN|nr:hypothetical protein HXX76_001102 [Chlamydomonas incerta]|eukprot:KAG2444346.1 hypothetical protein HXX76_001102 [Chlamydomonas incerta]
MDPSVNGGVKFAKASVVPIDTDEGADKSVRAGDRSFRHLRINTVVDVATPEDLADGMSRTKSGMGDSSTKGGKQYNRLAAQLAAKSMRRPSFAKSPSMKGLDDEDGKDEDEEGEGPEVGPWGILRKDQQRQTLWYRFKARCQKINQAMVIKPGMTWYQNWFYATVVMALFSGWVLPFHFAFMEPGALLYPYADLCGIVEFLGTAVFAADFVMKFFTAFIDPNDGVLVTSRARIAKHYAMSWKFYLDVLGWFPLDWIVTEPAAAAGASDETLRGLAWLKLLHLARLYRVFELFADLDYRMVLSQGTLMLTRNYTYVFYCTHWAACMLYEIASLQSFSPNSWVGRNAARLENRSIAEKYLLALYFSVSAFTGLGDSSLYAGSVPEAAFMILYLLFNLFLGAYILGTVTMLVVKGDERSKQFRDRMTTLNEFSNNNELPEKLQSAMQEHLEVTFHSEQVDDENVLGIYPTTIRRKVLRHLYLQPVKGCYLFKGCKQRFLDAFLTAARVELFMPGVQLLNEGDNVTELNIVVSGEVLVSEAGINLAAAFQQFKSGASTSKHGGNDKDGSTHSRRSDGSVASRSGSVAGGRTMSGTSMKSAMDFSVHSNFLELARNKQVTARYSSDALAEVPFFTDVPSNETVMSQSVVRVLSLPKAAWESLMQQFPQQARLVLTNMQNHTDQELEAELKELSEAANMPLESLRTALRGIRDKQGLEKVDPKLMEQAQEALSQGQIDHLMRLDDVRSLARSHVRKVDQVRTFDFLGAASDGDLETLRSMLSQGMSPNAADYDGRTGLMLAAVGGHEAVVRLLLDSGAKSDQLDAFGNSAMAEAVKNSHDDVIDLLLSYGGTLGMDEMAVASTMCTAVFEGDLVKLKRLLHSGAPPNACDYDKRCALHIAGAEGNLAAVKLLVEEGGADPGFQDRWGNTALDEARRVGAAPVVTYLEGLLKGDELDAAGKRHRQQVASDFLAACGQGDAARVRFMVANSAPGCVFTGMVLAASKGHKDVVEALVGWLAPGLLQAEGFIPLTEAGRMGSPGVVAVLRAAGVRLPDPADLVLTSALRNAVAKADIRVAAALLAAGVDAAAAAGPGGGSLLHAAAATGSLELVRRLVEEAGLKPAMEDGAGKTPAAIADAAQHGAIADYLRWAAATAAGVVSTSPAASSGSVAAQLAAAAASRFGALPDLTAANGTSGTATPGGDTAGGGSPKKGSLTAGQKQLMPHLNIHDDDDDDDVPLLIAQMPSGTNSGHTSFRSGVSGAAVAAGLAGMSGSRQPSMQRNRSLMRNASSSLRAFTNGTRLTAEGYVNAGSRPTSAHQRGGTGTGIATVATTAAAGAEPAGHHHAAVSVLGSAEAAASLSAAALQLQHPTHGTALRPLALPVLMEDEGGELGSSAVRSRTNTDHITAGDSGSVPTIQGAASTPPVAAASNGVEAAGAPAVGGIPAFRISGVVPAASATPAAPPPALPSSLSLGGAGASRPMTPAQAAMLQLAAETDAAAAAVAAASNRRPVAGSSNLALGSVTVPMRSPRAPAATTPAPQEKQDDDDLEQFLSKPADTVMPRPSTAVLAAGGVAASSAGPAPPPQVAAADGGGRGADASSSQGQGFAKARTSSLEQELNELSPPGV